MTPAQIGLALTLPVDNPSFQEALALVKSALEETYTQKMAAGRLNYSTGGFNRLVVKLRGLGFLPRVTKENGPGNPARRRAQWRASKQRSRLLGDKSTI